MLLWHLAFFTDWHVVQQENPETAITFLNATTKLFSDLENQITYLRRPGDAIAITRLIKPQPQHVFQQLAPAASITAEQQQQQQQQRLDRTRYLQSLPDAFPEMGLLGSSSSRQTYQSRHQQMRNPYSSTNSDDYNGTMDESEFAQDRSQSSRQARPQSGYYEADEVRLEPETNPERMPPGEILWNIHQNQTPSNQQILKELPYTLQGISSSTFTWVEPLPVEERRNTARQRARAAAAAALEREGEAMESEEHGQEEADEDDGEQTTTVLALPTGLPWQKLGHLNQLMEPAVLYRNIKEELTRRERNPLTGLVVQALNSSIEAELRSYLALVGVVETEIRRQEMKFQQQPTANSNSQRLPAEAHSYGIGGKITITRSIVLLQEATQGLRLVRTILAETKGLVGGQILSLIHSHTYNGDEFVAKFAARLLPQVAEPLFDILSKWTLSGQLIDPHFEFFIRKGVPPTTTTPATKSTGSSGSNEKFMWDGTFFLDYDYVPEYISREVAEQIFQIGKTLHFICVACDDREWVDQRKALSHLDPSILYSPDMLRSEVATAYAQVINHLNHILRTKFHLDAHLRGLKDYLLLGKGDFVQLLVESVAPILEKPAIQLFRHHLTATLETAVRGSNAAHDHGDVLRALDARMLELGHGDIGWDVFTLDYRVEEPLNTVIWDHKSMKEYLRVFNFLWRIKRVSFTLNTVWRRLTVMDRAATRGQFLRHPSTVTASNKHQHEARMLYKSSVYGLYHPLVSGLWQEVRLVCGEMLHFVNELEYYINYEVIEMAWGELVHKIQDGDLSIDEIVSVHKEYLRKITYKGLLGGGDFLMGELHSLLKIVLAFGITTEGLQDISERLRATLQTIDPQQDPNSNVSSNLLKRAKKIDATLQDLKNQFQRSLKKLVQALSTEEDSEMRFLGVRLDFNEFYSKLPIQ